MNLVPVLTDTSPTGAEAQRLMDVISKDHNKSEVNCSQCQTTAFQRICIRVNNLRKLSTD